jgi:hypothetical protein
MGELINCEYKIITIDSDSSIFKDATICDFYIKLDDPLRNVFKINLITMSLAINNTSSLISATTNILDPIYVNLNNYNRLIAFSTQKINNNFITINAFDSFTHEKELVANTTVTSLKNEYIHADTFYLLNPIDPQLTRFNVKLMDKTNSIIDKSKINRFVMKIGVYYDNKKTTRI